MSKQLTRNIVSLLVEVIQEADTVPGGVMECIFNQFENFASVSLMERDFGADNRNPIHRPSS